MRMRKLQVMRGNEWLYVFCEQRGQIFTLREPDRDKALPQQACWAESDLHYFSNKYANDLFRLCK